MNILLKIGATTLLGAILLRTLINYQTQPDTEVRTPSADEVVGHIPISDGLEGFLKTVREKDELIKVRSGVLVSYGLSFLNANIVILEGPDGLIVVDTAESPAVGAKALRQLRSVTKKPIKAIVFTHFHLDHIQGVEAFIEDPANPPDIYANWRLVENLQDGLIVGRKTGRGTLYQFGMGLGDAQVWPRIPGGIKVTPTRLPNKLIREEVEEVRIAGLNVTFIHVPGETTDHTAVWIAELGVVIPGDTVYFAFPNIFAIRGTALRDSLVWAASVRRLRALNADHLIYSHGRPLSGRQVVYDLLTAYSSAIQYVHDQTVRYTNELRHPDEIAKLVRLPPDLASNSFLQEFYGRVDWTSKSVYQRYVGWFSGDPVDLQPFTPKEKARRMADMVGEERMVVQAESALDGGDVQWALELSSQLLLVQPKNARAKSVRTQCLRRLAAEQVNPTARNYYLSAALEDYGLLPQQAFDVAPLIETMDLGILLNLLTVRLKAELTHGINTTLFLRIEDTKKTYRLQILHSVLTIDTVPFNSTSPEGQTVVTTRDRIWKGVMFGKLPAATAYTSGDLKVTGSLDSLKQFLAYF